MDDAVGAHDPEVVGDLESCRDPRINGRRRRPSGRVQVDADVPGVTSTPGATSSTKSVHAPSATSVRGGKRASYIRRVGSSGST